MKKKRNTRSTVSLSDVFIGFICLSAMAYFLFLFWQDLNVSFTKANEEPIAVIYFKKNTAQRKLIDSNIWERLKTSTPIYNGDKIRTAALSEAYTLFNDCSKIDLHENSLVQVFNNKNKNSIDFVSGSISVLATSKKASAKSQKTDKGQTAQKSEKSEAGKSGKKTDAVEIFQINTGSKILTFDENACANITISPKTVNQAVITVTAGEVMMKDVIQSPSPVKAASNILNNTPLGNAIKSPAVTALKIDVDAVTETVTTLTAGTSIAFEPLTLNEQLKEALSTFSVTMPSSTYSVTLSKNGQTFVPFFWSNSKEILVEFARDAAFSDVLLTKNLVSDTGRASVPVDFAKNESAVYWRAVPLEYSDKVHDSDLNDLPKGVIFINLPEEVKILESITTVFGDTSAAQMEAEVVENTEVAQVKLLEIINAPPVAKPEPVVEEEIAAESVVEQADVPADVVAEKATELKSEPAKDDAKAAAAKTTAAKVEPKETKETKTVDTTPALVNLTPKISSPKNGAVYTEDDFMVDVPAIKLKWNAVSGASSYVVEVFNGSSKQLLKKTVKSESFEIKDDDLAKLDNGTFTWKVTAKTSKEGKDYSSKTASSTFKIQLEDVEAAQIDTENLLQ